MDDTRFSTLSAVLLGLLTLASCLPLLDDDTRTLWASGSAGSLVGTRFAVALLGVVLVWAALARGRTTVVAAAQVVAGALAALAAAQVDGGGSGATLVLLVGGLALVGGLVTALAPAAPTAPGR